MLNLGLEDVRDDYDVIIIDTAPALSYITINAYLAADGLIIPLPPNALDFASSSQFWSLFSDFATGLVDKAGLNKSYDFINVLLSRVDSADSASPVVREWIQATYAEKVLPVEIPKTAVMSVSSAERFGTIYDITKYEGDKRTYKRARDAYDRLTDLVEQSIQTSWLAPAVGCTVQPPQKRGASDVSPGPTQRPHRRPRIEPNHPGVPRAGDAGIPTAAPIAETDTPTRTRARTGSHVPHAASRG